MYRQREYTVPRYEHRATAKHSWYCARTGSSSSAPSSPQDCQSAQISAIAPGSSGASASGGGSSSATRAGSVRYSIVSRSPRPRALLWTPYGLARKDLAWTGLAPQLLACKHGRGYAAENRLYPNVL